MNAAFFLAADLATSGAPAGLLVLVILVAAFAAFEDLVPKPAARWVFQPAPTTAPRPRPVRDVLRVYVPREDVDLPRGRPADLRVRPNLATLWEAARAERDLGAMRALAPQIVAEAPPSRRAQVHASVWGTVGGLSRRRGAK